MPLLVRKSNKDGNFKRHNFPHNSDKKVISWISIHKQFPKWLKYRGISSGLACYCSWGDAAALTEASHTYPKQFSQLPHCLWDSNISKEPSGVHRIPSHCEQLQQGSQHGRNVPEPPKRLCSLTAGAHTSPHTLLETTAKQPTQTQLNTERSKKLHSKSNRALSLREGKWPFSVKYLNVS